MLLFATALLATLPAVAQVPQIASSMSEFATRADFDDVLATQVGRRQSVMERSDATHRTAGISALGAVRILPTVSVGLGNTDNLYRTNDKTAASFISAAPRVYATTDWIQNAAWLSAGADIRRYSDRAEENREALNIELGGRLDYGAAGLVEAGAGFARQYEDSGLGAYNVGVASAIPYTRPYAYLRLARSTPRSKISFVTQTAKFNYRDITDQAGTPYDQDYRDQSLLRLQGKAAYSLRPSLAAFAQATFLTTQTPAVNAADRDSNDWRFLVGASFDSANLVRAELGVGYAKRTFKRDVADSVQGLAALVGVEYFPTELITVSARYRRAPEDSTLLQASGLIANTVELVADYELLRTLVVSASVASRNEDYSQDSRRDKIFVTSLSANYFATRAISLRLALEKLSRDSTDRIVGPNYDNFDAALNITYRR